MIHPNRLIFLKAPTIEEVEAVVKKAGVSESQFERYHQIAPATIRRLRFGIRPMPAKHWHLFLSSEGKEVPVSKVVSLKPTSKAQKQRVAADSRLNKLV